MLSYDIQCSEYHTQMDVDMFLIEIKDWFENFILTLWTLVISYDIIDLGQYWLNQFHSDNGLVPESTKPLSEPLLDSQE